MKTAGDDDLSPEARFALAASPLLSQVNDCVREMLPPGTDYSLVMFVPGEGGKEGHAVGISSDRRRMARVVAQWVMGVLEGMEGGT